MTIENAKNMLRDIQKDLEEHGLKLIRNENGVVLLGKEGWTEAPIKIDFNDDKSKQFDFPLY